MTFELYDPKTITDFQIFKLYNPKIIFNFQKWLPYCTIRKINKKKVEFFYMTMHGEIYEGAGINYPISRPILELEDRHNNSLMTFSVFHTSGFIIIPAKNK